jgi:hypothetical protein
VRAAGLGAGAGQALAAERLHADHRADLVAVDVDVADLRPRDDAVDGFVDARVDAQGQAVAGGVDLSITASSWSAFQRTTCSAGPKFSRSAATATAVPTRAARRRCRARWLSSSGAVGDELRFGRHLRGVVVQDASGVGVDHRADVGGQQAGIADLEFGHRAGEHAITLSAMSSCTNSTRAAEQRWPAEVNAEPRSRP